MGPLNQRRDARRGAIVAIAIATVVVGSARVARAEDRRGATTITSDGAIDTARVREHLDVELAGIDAARWPTHVDVVRTERGWNVHVVFTDGVADRSVAEADVDRGATARVLALVVAEAVRLHRVPATEPLTTSAAANADEPPRPAGDASKEPALPAKTAEEPARDHEGRASADEGRTSKLAFGADATFGLRWFSPIGTTALEPRLVVRLMHASGLGAELHALYLRSTADDVLGTATLDGFGGGASISYGFASWRAVRLRAGPRIDVAALRGSGDATSTETTAGSATAPFVTVAGEIVLRATIVGRTSVVFAADAGYVAQGLDLRADDRRPIVAKGLSAGVRLGVGFE